MEWEQYNVSDTTPQKHYKCLLGPHCFFYRKYPKGKQNGPT